MDDFRFPGDWYWFVGSDTTQVYSSKSGSFVPITDVNYVEWAKIGTATKIRSQQELADVLVQCKQRPINPTMLDLFLTSQINQFDQIQFKVLFNHENRIRALEGKQAITVAQFATALKGLIG